MPKPLRALHVVYAGNRWIVKREGQATALRTQQRWEDHWDVWAWAKRKAAELAVPAYLHRKDGYIYCRYRTWDTVQAELGTKI